MSLNKKKLLESAQKNLLKGQFDRAVYEYRQLIQLDPSDLRHRQKVAEILAKANQKEEALKEYAALAKIYIESTHYLKAIAVYKQIQKIDPTNPETSLTLASLNEKQGLIGNATAEYATAIQIYEKNGENLKALKALENMIALDSSNSAVKLRLAEKYFTTGSKDKSFDIFASTLKDLKERDDENGFTFISQRALNLFGNRAEKILEDLDSSVLAEECDVESDLKTVPANLTIYEPERAETPAENILPLLETDVVPVDYSDTIDSDEIEYIEDIIPLEEEDTVDTDFSDTHDEWEEDIDLNFLDSDHAVAEETSPEVFIADEELDDLELELEIEDIPATDSAPSAQIREVDLAEELSMFADEIDFNFLGEDKSDAYFDTSSSGLKKSELTNEDTESHYSLGLAYKEMGLFDEAISEFIFASRSPERRVDSMILQGVCLREIGNIGKAIEMLADTIKDSAISEDELLGLKYELALCYEESGEPSVAIELYSEIVKARPEFSDASAKLKKLSS